MTLIKLRKRRFLIRLVKHYRVYRHVFSRWRAFREAWALARL